MNKMTEMWDNRYSTENYAYGIAPNVFFKAVVDNYKLGANMLLPGEGEGRNAVYAAKQGLNVTAYDISVEGKNKALKLAAQENVAITYEIGDLFDLGFADNQFDAAALIFAHFQPALLSKYHQKIADLIKPNGLIFLEGFSKSHLKHSDENPNSGGPKNIEMLFTKESIRQDFPDLEIIQLEEVEVELQEGSFHNGKASVIRFIGRKK